MFPDLKIFIVGRLVNVVEVCCAVLSCENKYHHVIVVLACRSMTLFKFPFLSVLFTIFTSRVKKSELRRRLIKNDADSRNRPKTEKTAHSLFDDPVDGDPTLHK